MKTDLHITADAIIHRILPDDNLVLARSISHINHSDLGQWLESLVEDPNYNPKMRGFFDIGEKRINMNYEEVSQLAEEVTQRRLKANLWVVLTTSPMNTALALIYSRHLGKEIPFLVCSTTSEAERALHCPVQPFLDRLDQWTEGLNLESLNGGRPRGHS